MRLHIPTGIIQSPEQENVKTEILRSSLLSAVFLIGLVISVVNYAFLDEEVLNVYGGARMYFTVVRWFIFFLIYQGIILLYLRRKMRFNKPVSLNFKRVHALIEVTYPSAFMFYVLAVYGILPIIDSPITYLYFLFIILSILHLDFRVSVFAGVMSAIQYGFVAYYGFHYIDLTATTVPEIPENSFYLRCTLLVLCGGAAAFVSYELRNKIYSSYMHLQQKSELESLFGQQVSKEVSEALIKDRGASKRQDATVMFLDIRNFTTFAETHSAEEVIEYQNKFLGPVIDIINQHQGVVFQILGDGLMACFGSPVENVLHADMAYQAGLEILKRTNEANNSNEIYPTRIGIGLHSGILINGNIGSEQRKQFSISGTPVIIASRIEQLNKKYGTEFLISEDVYQRVTPGKFRVTLLGEEPLRGLETPVKVYSVEVNGQGAG